MRDTRQLRQTNIGRYLHEVLFSLYTAFLAVSLIFLFAPRLSVPFVGLEISLNRLLQIRQTDFIRGYFEYAISSIVLACCIGIPLHISSQSRLTKEILRSVSGVLLILGPPVFWVFYYEAMNWAFGWRYRWAPVELAVAVLCVTCYILRKWNFPWWAGVLLLAGHYNFWYWIPSSNPDRADYAGPSAPILGFCSALAWAAYAAKSMPSLVRESTTTTRG
jgi:hypothetical protein